MNTYELIFTIIAIILLLISILRTALWCIELKKDDSSTPVFSLSSIISSVFITIVLIFMLLNARDSFKPYFIMLVITMIISFPISCGTIITSKGIFKNLVGKNNYITPQDVKYQYNNDVLELYINGYKRVYRYNIKNTKTVKLLADWYPKYGYENPLTK